MPSFNGRFGNDGPTDTVLEKAAIAKGEHNRHMDRLKALGIEHGKQVIPLADGSVVISRKLGTLESVHVQAAPVDGTKAACPIDYYSGIMWGGNLAEGKEIEEKDRKSDNWFDSFSPSKTFSFAPTLVTANQFKLDDTKGQGKYLYEFTGTAYAHTPTTKLMHVVDATLNAEVAPFKATRAKTIYQTFMPSMYTGNMRKLVQFVLGVGKQFSPSYWQRHGFTYPSDKASPTGQMKFHDDLKEYYLAVDSVYDYTYDFRFPMCHNVYLESTESTDPITKEKTTVNRWWLLLVDRSWGVYAAPLELDPVSTTDAFKDWIKTKIADGTTKEWATVAKEVIDFWGGFPTGKGYDKYINRWVEAGVVGNITSESFTKYVGTASTFTNAVSWAFQYQKLGSQTPAKASVVAYEDQDIPTLGPVSYMTRKLREMDMVISFNSNFINYPVNDAGYGGAALSLIGELQHVDTEIDEPWLDAKIQRLTEADAEKLIRAAYPKFEELKKDWGPLDKTKAVRCLRELRGVPIIKEGSVEVTPVFKVCHSPTKQYVKFPDTNMDMCTSIWLPANTNLRGDGEYRSPSKGMSIPVHVWYDKSNQKHHVYEWTGGLKDKSYNDYTNINAPLTVYYDTHYGCAYVDTLGDGAENEFPDYYVGGWYQYKFDSKEWWKGWAAWLSSANDTSPEGLTRTDWVLRQDRVCSSWGGPDRDKARHVRRSVYIPLGDAEAAMVFRYIWIAGESAWTQSTYVTDMGNSVVYDWSGDIPWPYGTYPNHTDWERYATWSGGSWHHPNGYRHFPSGNELAFRPSSPVSQLDEQPVRIGGCVELGVGWVRHPTGGTFCDHWMKIESKCYYGQHGGQGFDDLMGTGTYPTVGTPSESSSGRGPKSEFHWQYHHGGDTKKLMELSEEQPSDGGRDYEYVSKDRAFLDILELQPSLFDPPEDSPFIEHDYNAVMNCWGDKSGQAMKAPNWYTYQVLGEQLDAMQQGATCCFVGPAVKK